MAIRMIEKPKLEIYIQEDSFRLRTISEENLEDLRVWKNRNKQYFFLKKDITIEQQKLWFRDFMNREKDFMFMVDQLAGNSVRNPVNNIGCMGFRIIDSEETLDIYNVMRIRKLKNTLFSMGDAFQLMLSFMMKKHDMPITCKVLKSNPALEWYKRNHFKVVDTETDYYLLQMEKNNFPMKKFGVVEK